MNPSRYKCFNPCCCGRCSRREVREGKNYRFLRLQSLLLWKMLSKTLRNLRSFKNPVSILVVVEDALEDYPKRWGSSTSFVSILVVVEDALEIDGEVLLLKSIRGFNPCCGGRCSRSLLCFGWLFLGLLVSILVVVEDALEDYIPPAISKSVGMFQSLLWWKMLSNCSGHCCPLRYSFCR